jgi:hypothetical protein
MEKQRAIEIIEEVLSYTRKNAKELGEAIGCPGNWIYEVSNPNRPNKLSRDKANRIVAAFPEISLSYLLTGEGTLLKADTIEGNIQQNINSSHITQNGNVEASANMDKLINVLAEQSQQVTKAQEQIDRLITLLERNSKN